MGRAIAEKVFIDPRLYAATPAETSALHAELAISYRPSSLFQTHPAVLSRGQVDRARHIAIALGGWCPVSSLSLAEEIIRLHDVLAAIAFALSCGRIQDALPLAQAECDLSWGQPLDTSMDSCHDRSPDGER